MLADQDGHERPLNSPNNVVVHSDGRVCSAWFTDPAYGDTLVEGHSNRPGGAANPKGLIRWRLGDELGQLGGWQRQRDRTFRLDPSGRMEAVVEASQVTDPNGLCFSPDYRTLYVVSPKAVSQQGYGGDQAIHAFGVTAGRVSRPRIFANIRHQGAQMNPDGIRADIYGNLWRGR